MFGNIQKHLFQTCYFHVAVSHNCVPGIRNGTSTAVYSIQKGSILLSLKKECKPKHFLSKLLYCIKKIKLDQECTLFLTDIYQSLKVVGLWDFFFSYKLSDKEKEWQSPLINCILKYTRCGASSGN